MAITTKLPSILEEAQAAVYGPRQHEYGHPRINLKRTAILWQAYLNARPGLPLGPAPLTAQDVAYMQVLLKLARLMQTPTHRDSIVDMAGYSAAAARVVGVDE